VRLKQSKNIRANIRPPRSALGHKQTFAVQNGVFAFTLAEHTPARCLHQKIERDTNDPCAARGADLETVL